MTSPSTSTTANTSTSQYRSFGGRELQLNIIDYNRDSFEIQIINKNYSYERSFRFKAIVTLALTYLAYIVSSSSRLLIVDVASLLTLAYLIYTTIELVKSEKILFVAEFALQITTEKSRRSSIFIPATNIKDVVINEVIDDLAIKYVLITRTKGSLSHSKPIIAMFKSLQPRIECLEIVYTHFLKKLDLER
ncbi:uncharacterized protein LOC129914624 [Episyrphus balteatus]|uniref:uncharacterized protein LOC129914624 n=1 Tax=Episyrphus balteatus TaxID=286459 RepID=UPI002486A951|nr:uncharacterized protein LOC129914624 [Episyrphus balteatus]XP_055849935.1 uncharacterized protein LOC129914624 [Episyrphus balteatus]